MIKFNQEFINLIKESLNLDYEICGPIYKNFNGELFSNNISGGNSEGRKFCTNNYVSNVEFHTHPSSSKWYPSGEDICNVSIVSRRRNIDLLKSFIFNQFGFWTITLIGEKTNNYSQKKEISKYVDKNISDILYDYNKGLDFPSDEDFNNYFIRINELFPNIELKFYKW